MNLNDIFEQRDSFYLKTSNNTKGALVLFLVIGLAAFVGGLFVDQTRAWGALLFNMVFFYTLALGGIAFGGMQDTVGAVWGRPIKRLHESFSMFLTPATVIFIGFLLSVKFNFAGARGVYEWIADPSMLDHFEGKKVWLVENFMIIRDIFALLFIWVLAKWQMKQSVARDMAMMAGNRDEAMELGFMAKQRLRFWCGPILVGYAVAYSLLVFDLTMSLEPLWFSTLWGGWFFGSMMHSLMAFILLMMFWLKDTNVGHLFGRQQYHDIGKLMHGFTAFFGYLTFAHVLTYWYGNVPEETEYFIHRLHGPWLPLVIATGLMVFAIPMFALIPKISKWSAVSAISISIMIFVAQWLVNLLVVMPDTADAATWKVPWMEVGLFLGIFALFMKSFLNFGAKVPMIGVADPLLGEALSSDH